MSMFHLVKAARLPAALRVVRGDVRKLPVRPVRAEEGAAPRRRLAAGELRRILACFFSCRDFVCERRNNEALCVKIPYLY